MRMLRGVFPLLMISLCLPGAGLAISTSIADLAFGSYGATTHEWQDYEWLGASGTDYDGVSWTPFLPGQSASLTCYVTINDFWGDGPGWYAYEYLDVWIDWDQDRTWEEAEHILDMNSSEFFYDGPEFGALTFQVPTAFVVPMDALVGTTWMRSRVGFDGDYTPSSYAYYGEVEDYEVNVAGAGAPIPEPTTLLLLGSGLLGLVGCRSFRNRRQR